MTTAHSPAAHGLVTALRRVFGDRLRSVVAYGPHAEGAADAPLTSLALVSSLTAADLEACARAAKDWRRAGIATPLVMPDGEFRDSLDAFPLEYGEIIRAHVVLFGEGDPFAGVTIARTDLRRACETQVKSHLVHLREGFIDSGGGPTDVAHLVRASAPAFAALLRNVARLAGVHSSDRMDTALQGARAAGLGDGVIADVLALERPAAVPTADAARLFPGYLDAVERLSRAVDAWPE